MESTRFSSFNDGISVKSADELKVELKYATKRWWICVGERVLNSLLELINSLKTDKG